MLVFTKAVLDDGYCICNDAGGGGKDPDGQANNSPSSEQVP